MPEHPLDQAQRIKMQIWEAQREVDRLSSEPVGREWPEDAAELSQRLAATLHAAAILARELYAATPRWPSEEDNVIRPKQWGNS